MSPPQYDGWPPRRALPRRGADLARRRARTQAALLYGGIYFGSPLIGGWAASRWPHLGLLTLSMTLLVAGFGISGLYCWRNRIVRPQHRFPAVSMTAAAQARWSGPLLLGAAALYLVGLGALRARFPAVPDVLWIGIPTLLLAFGGARLARAFALHADRARLHRRVAHGALLAGSVGLVVGALSARESADAWSDGARAVGALALCAALALLPFGLALRRRLAPVLRARDAMLAERRAWFAAVYPSGVPGARAASPEDAQPPVVR